MTEPDPMTTSGAENRARASLGTSKNVIHRRVAEELVRCGARGTLFDIGCGTGTLKSSIPPGSQITKYVGVDIVRYETFPPDADFIPAALDQCPWPIASDTCDIACCVETIEHLENPRALFRELKRITRPGGYVVVTTPNNLTLLSLLTLIVKHNYNAFQEGPGLYPAHITALLPIDLQRIAIECGLANPQVAYTNAGRMPGTSALWPASLGFRGRLFSDNVLLIAQRAAV